MVKRFASDYNPFNRRYMRVYKSNFFFLELSKIGKRIKFCVFNFSVIYAVLQILNGLLNGTSGHLNEIKFNNQTLLEDA